MSLLKQQLTSLMESNLSFHGIKTTLRLFRLTTLRIAKITISKVSYNKNKSRKSKLPPLHGSVILGEKTPTPLKESIETNLLNFQCCKARFNIKLRFIFLVLNGNRKLNKKF